MSAPTATAKSATVGVEPESPTTARPFEMSDNDRQDTIFNAEESVAKLVTTTTTMTGLAPSTNSAAKSEIPALPVSDTALPAKPPQPLTESENNVQMLKEAFPSVEPGVIKAILSASGGHMEPAFNALLEMTDPGAAERNRGNNDVPPPPPPRPAATTTSTAASQLEADELYARQLAEQFENMEGGLGRDGPGDGGMFRGRQQTGLGFRSGGYPEARDERQHSFMDDDLPVIRENLRKGFLETQTKVNSWFSNLKKRFDEEFGDKNDEHEHEPPRLMQGGSSSRHQSGWRSRQGQDYERYDADPEVLGDDFAGMNFNSNGIPVANRPVEEKSNLFRTTPPFKFSRPGVEGQKVTFNDAAEDIDAYDASPRMPPRNSSLAAGVAAAKSSKWQPLSTMEPAPVGKNDPFSLGDSDDEKEHSNSCCKGGIKLENNSARGVDLGAERLRKAAAEAIADSLVEDKKTGGAVEKD